MAPVHPVDKARPWASRTLLTLTYLRIAGKWCRRLMLIEHHVLTADPWIASTYTSSNENMHQLHPDTLSQLSEAVELVTCVLQ